MGSGHFTLPEGRSKSGIVMFPRVCSLGTPCPECQGSGIVELLRYGGGGRAIHEAGRLLGGC